MPGKSAVAPSGCWAQAWPPRGNLSIEFVLRDLGGAKANRAAALADTLAITRAVHQTPAQRPLNVTLLGVWRSSPSDSSVPQCTLHCLPIVWLNSTGVRCNPMIWLPSGQCAGGPQVAARRGMTAEPGSVSQLCRVRNQISVHNVACNERAIASGSEALSWASAASRLGVVAWKHRPKVSRWA